MVAGISIANGADPETVRALVLNLLPTLLRRDPSVSPILASLELPDVTASDNDSTVTYNAAASSATGSVATKSDKASLTISGATDLSWATSSTTSFQAQTLTADSAAVTNSGGTAIGNGPVQLNTAPTSVAISGNAAYALDGTGTASFYELSQMSLGVSGDWQNYTATVTGERLDHAHRSGRGPHAQRPGPPRRDVHDHDQLRPLSPAAARCRRPTSPARPRSQPTNGTINLGPGNGDTLGRRQAARSDRRNDAGRLHRHDHRLGQRRRHRFGLAQRQRGQRAPGHGQLHPRSRPTRTRRSRSRRTSRRASPTLTTSRPMPHRAGRSRSTAAATSPRRPRRGSRAGPIRSRSSRSRRPIPTSRRRRPSR